jgi:hypothetical protein
MLVILLIEKLKNCPSPSPNTGIFLCRKKALVIDDGNAAVA